MWGNQLFQVPLAPKPLLVLGFGGDTAEMSISREGFLGEAGLMQAKVVSKSVPLSKSPAATLLQGVPRALQGRTCRWATSSHGGTVIGGEEEKDIAAEKS